MDSISKDVLIYLMKLMPPRDVLALGAACRRFHHISENDNLWSFLVKRDFNITVTAYTKGVHYVGLCLGIYIQEYETAKRYSNCDFSSILKWAAYDGNHRTISCALRREIDAGSKMLALGFSIEQGHIHCVSLLLNDIDTDLCQVEHGFIARCLSENYVELIELLFIEDRRIDPSIMDNYCLRAAAAHGHWTLVYHLIHDKRVDPAAQNNYAIIRAAWHGHLDVVNILLLDERVDPSARDSCALRKAAENGHYEIVKRLLTDDRVDPTAKNNSAVKRANSNWHFSVVRILLQDERVQNTLDPASFNALYERCGMASRKQV
jgi:hypothetical protein